MTPQPFINTSLSLQPTHPTNAVSHILTIAIKHLQAYRVGNEVRTESSQACNPQTTRLSISIIIIIIQEVCLSKMCFAPRTPVNYGKNRQGCWVPIPTPFIFNSLFYPTYTRFNFSRDAIFSRGCFSYLLHLLCLASDGINLLEAREVVEIFFRFFCFVAELQLYERCGVLYMFGGLGIGVGGFL